MFVAASCVWLLVFIPKPVAAEVSDPCVLPHSLEHEIAAKFSRSRPVRLSDLDKDDKEFFQKDHGDACPGLVKVDFYGDGKPTLAAILLTNKGAKGKAKLIIAHQLGKRWTIKVLDTADAAPAPVLWSQSPGKYRDISGTKQIQATRPVVILSRYESWTILYSWTDRKISKIWLMD